MFQMTIQKREFKKLALFSFTPNKFIPGHDSPSLVMFLIVCALACAPGDEADYSQVTVNIDNYKDLDSLVIYDKENSWAIKSSFRFESSGRASNTFSVTERKIYPMYIFLRGEQSKLGELLMGSSSSINITVDEKHPHQMLKVSGDYTELNNTLALSHSLQFELSSAVRAGMSSERLVEKIEETRGVLLLSVRASNSSDNLLERVMDDFDDFSETLKKKNEKYVYKSSLVGSLGNQFAFTDLNSDMVSLSDFMGDYLYVDVWATWCKPCKHESLLFEKLQEQFSVNDDLKFISVSIDKEVDKWKGFRRNSPSSVEQFHFGAKGDFIDFYDIGSLPRFILLNRTGHVVDADAIRPSNPNTASYLDSLLEEALFDVQGNNY